MDTIYKAVIHRIQYWLEDAVEAAVPEPTAMNLATAGFDGSVHSRTVLLKSVDFRGLTFYTNRQSDKGQQLMTNPRAALCLVWLPLQRQIRVEGRVVTVSDAESDVYFASRHPISQTGAWASDQSRPLDSRQTLEKRVTEYEQKFASQPAIPRPPHWGGYRVIPDMVEFWSGQDFRLHDREVFHDRDGQWRMQRLFP